MGEESTADGMNHAFFSVVSLKKNDFFLSGAREPHYKADALRQESFTQNAVWLPLDLQPATSRAPYGCGST